MTLDPDRLREVADFLDGDRGESGYRNLEEWLAGSSSAVRAFVAQLRVEEDLRQLSLEEDVSRYMEGSEIPESHHIKAAVNDRGAAKTSRLRLAILAIAASLLVVTYSGLRLLLPSGLEVAQTSVDPHAPPSSVPITAAPEVVATLVDVRECRWGGPAADHICGDHFELGAAIQLLSGVAQLTFESGAVLILQGPCQLDLGDNAIALEQGRVSAVVPRSALGFAVTTPTAEVVDLGTEFGVSVDPTGSSQVHVFSGEVVTRARNQEGVVVGEPMFVTTHKAIHFRPGTEEADRFEADEAAFIRWLEDLGAPQLRTRPPVDGKLSLWLQSRNWVLDRRQRVNAWKDTLSPENLIPDNALQAKPDARPRVVEHAIGGLPAVRFDGIDDCLITTPMSTGDSQTIVFVASVRGDTHEFQQLINYNGPPQYRPLKTPRPAILQIEATLDGQGFVRLYPYAYVGFENGQAISVGRAGISRRKGVHPPLANAEAAPRIGEPIVVAYSYDHSANHAELWVNSRSLGSSTAPTPIGVTTRKVIGRHGGYPRYFCGDVAELMIFDEGLDSERISALCRALADKYQIAVSP